MKRSIEIFIAIFLFASPASGGELFSLDSPEVTDGDSLVSADGERIRLVGFDAWELSQTCPAREGGNFACGESAKRHLEVLTEGRTVICEAVAKDVYGRLLARCRVAGTEISLSMVDSGWGICSEKTCRALEAKAKAARVGGWAGHPAARPQSPKRWRKAHTR